MLAYHERHIPQPLFQENAVSVQANAGSIGVKRSGRNQRLAMLADYWSGCLGTARRPAMNLALFDLDNTLLAGDSDFEWAQFLVGKGVLDRELHEARNVEFYEQYKAGTLDIGAFLQLVVAT